jgi:predicted alpha/beta superfamily hydrolase
MVLHAPVIIGDGANAARRDGRLRRVATSPSASKWLPYRALHPGASTVVGDLRVLPQVESPELGNRRDLLVHLPPSYTFGERRFPVLYMQDGQNLFDAATSFSGEWRVDETMVGLAAEGREAIVVGVANAGAERLDEYSPWRGGRHGGGRGDAYVRFLVETVRPLVDAEFRTRREARATGVLGSSLGGLISLYAFFSRPEVFGMAGALSPALRFAGDAMLDFLARRPHVGGRVYLDTGTREGGVGGSGGSGWLDRWLAGLTASRPYTRAVRRARRLLEAKGYRAGEDLLHVEEPGGLHHEAAWSRRLPAALRFLLRGVD